MTRQLSTLLFLVLLPGAPAIGAGPELEVRVQHDEEFDFTTVESFGWLPDARLPGRARFEENAEIIREEIAAVLTQKGLRFEKAPDVLVIYYVGLQDQVSITREESGETHEDPYEQGTLILEVYALGRELPVWRGEAEDALDRDHVRKQVRKIVTRLLKQFPPS